MATKNVSDDTYELNPSFPVHMNRVWMKKYHGAEEHYHWHDFFEISLVCSGCARFFVDGLFYPVRQGDVAIFRPGEVHGWYMKEDVELLVMTFSEEIVTSDPYVGEEILSFFREGVGGASKLLAGGLTAGEVRHSLLEAWREWNGQEPGKNAMIKAELLRILCCLNRAFGQDRADTEPARKRRRDLKRLDPALRYLDVHYREKVSMAEVAATVGMSPGYFSKLFHALMGQRYVEYVTQKRIYKAKELLETTDQTVVDIALESGFNSVANFYRTYRRFYHKAPRA